MTGQRLPTGGRIDRATRLGFQFDGAAFTGHPGDTLASALIANGRLLMGRSFKYHRPRGPVTANAAEPNALMTIGTGGRREPNSRATLVDLYDGLVAESQNRWPSLGFDIGALNGLIGPFLSAGFYYKTFMWPKGLWEKLYEPFIRRAAGLGRAGYEPHPDAFEKRWGHCDLLIVGAGPAGLAAALTAARSGADVVLADDGSEPGGSLATETATIGGASAEAFLGATLAELKSLPNVRILTRTTVFGWYDDMVFGAVERVTPHGAVPAPGRPVERLWRIAARRAILATGAEERPLVFGGNDRPGIVTCDAATTYARRHGVAIGSKVAVFANSAAGARTAASLAGAGVGVVALIDTRADAPGTAGPFRTLSGATVIETSAGSGADRHGLGAIKVDVGGRVETIAADALAMSGGFSPRIHLACQRGGKARWDAKLSAFLAPEGAGTLPLAGSAAGAATLAACLDGGAKAAAAALADLGRAAHPAGFGAVEGDWDAAPVKPLWRVKGSKAKAFVDFQNDVHADDLGLAVREGYDHVELAKRYTTNGMATDQGKLGNVAAIGILAETRGVTPAEIGTTTFRPFYTPVSFGALAGPSKGKHFQPTRRSPLHGWAEKNGAVFVETGLWYRTSYFPRDGETHWRQAVDREVLAVRAGVGLTDVSTLGKIEVAGPDAAEFLDRIYSNGMKSLPVGRARYGLMLREDGFVYDDGTVSRLADDRYFVTTTTAQAAGALAHMEFAAQAIWPELDVAILSISDQWAQMAIAGPRSRDVLARVVDQDISDAACSYLAVMPVTLGGGKVEGLLFRLSYSGERAYELAVPAGYGESVADALMAAGAEFGITPYGVETLGVLRIEKGHVTHNEINGTVTAADIGLGGLVSKKKRDFIGKHLLDREGLKAADRPQLVGIVPLDKAQSFKTGAHVLRSGDAPTLENDQGYVSSSAYSPHVGSTIGLALVVRGRERHGEEVVVWNALAGETVPARIVAPVFVDPTGERLHG